MPRHHRLAAGFDHLPALDRDVGELQGVVRWLRADDADHLPSTVDPEMVALLVRVFESSIWATNLAGNLELIARTGNFLEVAPGDSRVISDVQIGGFNNLGQVAFRAEFTDGTSGAFVSNLVAVPEPHDRRLHQ